MSRARLVCSTALRNVTATNPCLPPLPRLFALSTSQMSTNTHNIFSRALLPKAHEKKLTPAEIWARRSESLDLPPPPNTFTGMPLTLITVACYVAETAVGRKMVVTDGDFRGALIKLGRRLKANNVLKEFRQHSRHEKKGDKRARLRSERWRKQFADEVRRKVQLVVAIRRRGG
ncbi:hypothetical protein F5I97DRAFT_1846631 [Phlebopus sp. FC_14]|nr:hypothetical protein F5I97DRAFT_1846631 [Phlebopus sp. FC_14]